MAPVKLLRVKYILSVLWLLFTLAFAGWWLILGLRQLEQIGELMNHISPALERHRRMMIWEGTAWLLLLAAGGCSLIWLLLREDRRSQALKEFFSSFSHDIKTSLASLRLQAESLQEDLNAGSTVDRQPTSPLLERLVSDTVRLQLQLENSLFLGQSDRLSVFLEPVVFSQALSSQQMQWRNIEIIREGDATLKVDKRVLYIVLSNLIHNAIVHGGATKIWFLANNQHSSVVKIYFIDNGTGFSGERKKLGKIFYRHNARSGSSVGLHIVRQLVRTCGGQVQFGQASIGSSLAGKSPGHSATKGFGGQLTFQRVDT